MKAFIIIIITLVTSVNIYSQGLTQEEKQRIIDSLDSNNSREN